MTNETAQGPLRSPNTKAVASSPDVRVNSALITAYNVVPHSKDVTLNQAGISAFAKQLVEAEGYLPTQPFWADEPLHPVPSKHGPQYIADWIFCVSLLNFSFWSDLGDSVAEGRYAVRFRDGIDGKGKGVEKDWTGYWSLPAALNRALAEGTEAISAKFWSEASDEELANIFRPAGTSRESIPLWDRRLQLLREAGRILQERYKGSFYYAVKTSSHTYGGKRPTIDALDLVQLVVDNFPMFRDEAVHPEAGKVYLWKRPQILVAELWAAYESVKQDTEDFPIITGISSLTMFADYRVPQILNYLQLIDYSPDLQARLQAKDDVPSGSRLEIELRCLSIAAVEELRKEVASNLHIKGRFEESRSIHAVLLDFWLWNKAKDFESTGMPMVQCHRTRSIWY